MKYLSAAVISLVLLASLGGFAAANNAQLTIPTITIISVVQDTSVTIQTNNFPSSQTFIVTMGKFGTLGVDGIQVGTIDSGDGSSIETSFDIPAELRGLNQIAIRTQSSQGFFSYNWFNNRPTSAPPETPAATPSDGSSTPTPGNASGIPLIAITEVVPDQQVTIKATNFPANQTFTVTMGKIGTKGVGGIVVDKTDSPEGGSFSATYSIPPDLAGQALIAIRLQSPQGFFSYNWFTNNSTNPTTTPTPEGTGVATTAPSAKIPTISITAVVRDSKVTINTANFPASQTFIVTMGKFGTQGLGGIQVGTIDSGEGGSIEASFDIPSELQGLNQIAIRAQSTQGFFSFNWFWNQDTQPQ
ncbi:MAG: hypothetical protein PHQ40_08025 [Anaerolineaceae bacterium]|nr:hypothetical protein [Anaerolineaceae bacterium]